MKGNIDLNTAKSIMKLRLNMLELKCNYKGKKNNEICDLCGDKNDTTEHLFECRAVKKHVKNIPSILTLERDEDEAYEKLGKFMNEVCVYKKIDTSKTVKENLERKSGDMYTIKKVENNGLKITLCKV